VITAPKSDAIHVRLDFEGKEADDLRAFKESHKINSSKDAVFLLISQGYRYEALVSKTMRVPAQ
jgi:hypothetical protein